MLYVGILLAMPAFLFAGGSVLRFGCQSLLFAKLFDGIGPVFHVDVDPHQPRYAKDVHKVEGSESDEQPKRPSLAQAQKPVKKGHKQQAEPTHPDVRDEHRTVVVARFWEIVEVARRAALQHIEGLGQRPTSSFKRFAFVASGAFEVKNAVRFRAFFAHVACFC